VFVDVTCTGHLPTAWMAGLAVEGVRVTVTAGRVRMLTHRDVDASGIDAVLAAWRKLATDLATTSTSPSPR
jgi:hypothetical protein